MNGSWNHKLALPLLMLVSAQATFLVPYVVLVSGERTNLFTPALMLLPAFTLCFGAPLAAAQRTWLPWAVLGLGLGATSLASTAPFPALLRAFAFFVPAVAGLLCARRLLLDDALLRLFLHFLTFCFTGLIAVWYFFGQSPPFSDLHHHALTGVLVLLSAGPLYLCLTRRGALRWGAALLLAFGYVLCLLAGSRFIVLAPLVLLPFLWAVGRLRLSTTMSLVAVAVLFAGLFFYAKPYKIFRLNNYESTFYRLEGIPASLELIRQHPLLGIGIRTPRDGMLAAYEPVFGMVDRETFLEVVKRNVTADNQYLSLPVGVGLPLATLYFFLIYQLFRGYLFKVFRNGSATAGENAFLIPLLVTVLHFLFYDGLFYPQVSWFFHLLLGVGARYPVSATGQSRCKG